MLVPFAATGPLCAIVSARVMTATGRYKELCMVGIALSGAAMVFLAFSNQATPLWVTATALAVFGIGGGLSGPARMVGIQKALGAEDSGTGTAARVILDIDDKSSMRGHTFTVRDAQGTIVAKGRANSSGDARITVKAGTVTKGQVLALYFQNKLLATDAA